MWDIHTECGKKSRKDEAKKGDRHSEQERKRDKVIGTTEYVLRPRQSEEREEVQPGRKPGISKVK